MKAIYKHFKLNVVEAYNIVKQIDPIIAEKVKDSIFERRTTYNEAGFYARLIRHKEYTYKRLLVSINKQGLDKYFCKEDGLTIEGYIKYTNNEEKLALLVYENIHNMGLRDKLLSNSLAKAIDTIRDEVNDPNEIALCNMILYRNRFGYIRSDDKNFTITKQGDLTFCPKGKVSMLADDGESWHKANRMSMKFGRAIMRMLDGVDYRFPESTVENIVNLLKSQYTFTATFEVVRGEDIRKYYHYSMYASNTNTLGNSCMRHSSCQDYFDVYVKNCEMLIAKNNDGKIVGRAILWQNVKTEDSETIKLMDRIYGNDMTIRAFKTWASHNGYCYKQYQSYSDNKEIIKPNGQAVSVEMDVEVKGGPFTFMPYMDTFKYTDERFESSFILNNDSGGYELTNTEGNVDDDEDYVVLNSGERVHQDDARYVEMYDEWFRDEDVVYCEDRGEYILYDESVEIGSEYIFHGDAIYIDYLDEHVRKEDAMWSEYSQSYILTEDAVPCEATSKIIRRANAIEIDGKFYCPDSVPCES